jgi:flagellar motor switch protein FliG
MNGLIQRGGGAAAPGRPGQTGLTRSQKAAAVLLAVGPDVAAGVLEHLSEAEVEQIAFEVATLEKVAPDRMNDVLQEFHDEFVAHQHIVAGGAQQARELLRRWRGDEADEIVDRLLATVQLSPFHFVRQYEARELIPHLREEHPQTIALVLAHLPAKFSAQVLAGLEPHLQGEVALRLATMDHPANEVVSQVEAALEARLGGRVRRAQRVERGGVRELASLLNHADRGTERAIIGNLEVADPELAEQVRALMFVFEDIVSLDDRSIQQVLRTVDAKKLALALKGVRTDVREAVIRNLSERAQQTLNEEIEILGPVRTHDVEAAQTEIVRIIRRLDEEGVIVINRGGEGDFIE